MNKKQTMFILLSLLYLPLGFALTPIKNKLQDIIKPRHYNVEGMANYNNFSFKSDASGNYNQFSGHSYLYMVGGHNTRLRDNLLGGLLFYNSNVKLTSHVLLQPGQLVNTHQTIHNNNLMGHLLQQFTPHWYGDLMGSYGQSRMSYFSSIPAGNTEGELFQGSANGQGNNFFISVTGGYVATSQSHFLVRSYLTLLYNQINQQSFAFNFPTTLSNNVPSLVNRSVLLLEHLEITYDKSEYMQPFVSGGLLEVLDFSNSRPIVDNIVLIGSLPEFNLNQNGFRVGGGINFNYKQWMLRLEQQYDQRGSVYHSNQSIVTLILTMS